MGKRNGWLGGDGDQWERGPYWIDGLLPLAYILNDKELIAKVKPWVEWSIKSQRPDGLFGPTHDLPQEPGIQRDNSAGLVAKNGNAKSAAAILQRPQMIKG
jgi:hypothetical protein